MKKNGAQSGFTLIEMMVSLAVFMVVAVVAVGALLKIVDANRKSETLQATINNVNFAFDAMSRELRVGSDYTCESGGFSGSDLSSGGAGCASTPTNSPGGTSISFLSSNTDPNSGQNLVYSYWIAPHPDGVSGHWTIVKAQQAAGGDDIESTNQQDNAYGTYAPILDPSVVITSYAMAVSTAVQPKMFVYMSGYAGATVAQRTYFDIQTTISERI